MLGRVGWFPSIAAAIFEQILSDDFVRVTVRFFRGIPHPHLLGVCRPDIFYISIVIP